MDTFELDYLKDHQDAKAPLNIIPVLVYHGLEKWTISVQRGRLENIVFFDLSSMPEEQIKGTPVLKIVLLTLKYIKSEENVTKIDRILEIFKEVKGEPEMKEYVRLFTYYVEHAAKPELKDMLVQKMNHFFTDEELESSTVIRELEKIGEKRGEKRGLDMGANKGAHAAKLILTTRKGDEEIGRESGLAVEKIRELRNILV